MKVVTFFVSYPCGVGNCDNKVNTFVVTFSLSTGEKNVTSQNVKVADAKGSLPHIKAAGDAG